MHTNWCDITKKKYQNREPYEQYDRNTHTHTNDGFCLVTQTLIFITLLTSEFGWFDEHVLLPLILCDNFFSFVQSLFFFFVFLRKRKWTNYNNLRDSLWRKRNPNNENKRQSKTRFIEKEEHDDDDDNHKKKHHPNTEKKSIMNIYGEILRLKY